jgi:NAD(P)-dependent dehydrogenase (short-subunit alcohol dehydrogenase family)
MPWTPAQIPDQTGRVVIVTGANSGIGFHTARHLAEKGAEVILACRNMDKAEAALARIREGCAAANVRASELDLSELASVENFAERTLSEQTRLDLLINNAGIMIPPYGQTSAGHELQFATNHLGHFALTGRLLERLDSTEASKVVTVSSIAHRRGRIRFEDMQFERRYSPWGAYGQSKLANLLFTYELDRKLKAAGSKTSAVAAHPGYASTGITQSSSWMDYFTPWTGQSADLGSWPTLRAATDATAESGSYWGPRWLFQIWGAPKRVGSNRASRDKAVAARLWSVSEELSGVSYRFA